jgi:type I restriction-modification system DNA methylase subunit
MSNQEAFEVAFAKVSDLVKTFQANEARYFSSDYQEAEARKDFIDKFFIALGWDVNHDEQTNPYEQEVKVEKNAAGQRRADYAFYLAPNFHDVRFFVEAKKPHGDLATAENYFQTIRYGWNSETPLAVLTDFAQFHILDCRYKPDPETAINRRVAGYHYGEYTDREKFAEIYWLFSHEAAAAGSLEKWAKERPKPRAAAAQRGLFAGGYQSIDESFLKELDEYRIDLAKAFKHHNPDLDSETLTELAQRTLDRLVFLRFLEDKGIEPARLVDNFGDKGTAWEEFVAASRRLNGIYNGIVFRQHAILDAPNFQVDDRAFAGICERLSHINSPYNFDIIPIHILGSIYERFLGKVIVATDKRVRVEEKPEVRKAGGVHYTPEYIARYIVENTIGKLIAGKTPDQIAEMRFADISCGSGSFLLAVYYLLLNYHGNYHNRNPGKARKGDCIKQEGKLYLSLGKKREILLNNIYGVDIDFQAVEVCQLSLYLKLLQDETAVSARQYQLEFAHVARLKKLLPDLSKNIVCGNSLIGRDILEGELFDNGDERKLNPMNFKDAFPDVMRRGGFDAVVGNPPYVRQESLGQALKDYTKERFAAYASTADLYTYFIERAHKLLRPGGLFGYIVSNKFIRANYGRPLRNFLFAKTTLLQIIDFGELPVFANAATFPAIVLTRNAPARKQSFAHAAIKRLDFSSLADEVAAVGKQLDEASVAGGRWTLAAPAIQAVLEKIKTRGVPLGDYLTTDIYRGVITGLTEAFAIDGPTAAAIIRKNPRANALIKPFVLGDDIRHYEIERAGRFLICIPNGWTQEHAGSKAGWDWFAKKYGALAAHLAPFERKARERCDQGQYWWELRPCDYYPAFEAPKIIYPDIAKESRFCLDEEGLYSANTTYIIPSPDKYLLGILNSRLIFTYYKSIAAVLGDPDKGGASAGSHRTSSSSQFTSPTSHPQTASHATTAWSFWWTPC